jgi:dTMP kinase
VLTLLWGPAKDATVPNIVKEPDQLATANTLGMFAAYGTLPIGSILFALMAALSSWVSSFSAVSPFRPEQASLAIWVDAITFLVSALLISGLHIPKGGAKATEKQTVGQTWRDVVDGLRFIRSAPLVRGVMIGLAGGLIGGGSMIPLGAVFATDVLNSTPSAYGFLTTSLGIGAAAGVITLLWLQKRLPRVQVFFWSVILAGIALVIMAWVTTLAFAIVLVATVGAGAGCAYVTGFTLLQESVSDEMRGRTFATLYTVVRVCLLLSLTIGPFVASALDAISEKATDKQIEIGSATLTLEGVQLTLFLGGIVTVGAGFAARRRMRKTQEDLSVL